MKEDAEYRELWSMFYWKTWYGQTTQYPVFPASKTEGKGKESLVVRNSESELKVWNEGNEPSITATNSNNVLAC